jgi:hypothetical protein
MHCVAIFATKKGKEFAILYADFGHNTLRVARKVLLLFAPSVDAERTILGCPRGMKRLLIIMCFVGSEGSPQNHQFLMTSLQLGIQDPYIVLLAICSSTTEVFVVRT